MSKTNRRPVMKHRDSGILQQQSKAIRQERKRIAHYSLDQYEEDLELDESEAQALDNDETSDLMASDNCA